MHSPIGLALIYLVSMIVMVPIAKRLGLGAVLGYLIAGSLLGPHVLGWVSGDNEDVMHLAEFGVIMMLFVIGLELKPALLWKLRGPIFGLGSLQVGLTAVAFLGLGVLTGRPWQGAAAVGLILAMSSTAIVLKTLEEEGALKTDGGQAAFSTLLFQDVAVIPVLAAFAFLASSLTGAVRASDVPAWQQALHYLGAVVGVVFAGKWIVRPLFRVVLGSQIHELTTALGLAVVLATSVLMTAVGLSPALGAFLAGVVLAESEYRHQLESDIGPFKSLLLGIFFISIGAQINYGLVVQEFGQTLTLVTALVAVKFAVLWIVGRIGRLSRPDTFLYAVALAQGGEFAFVLLGQAGQMQLLAAADSQLLMAAVALSMASAPLLMQAYFKWIAPRFATAGPARESDVVDMEAPVIVAGIGRFGQMITRFLKAAGFSATILDFDAEQVDLLRRFNTKAFYGDASRLDLLRSAGIERAKLLILAIDDAEKTLEIVDTVQKHFPHVRILARAYDRIHAYALLNKGVQDVTIETAGSALEVGRQALERLGFRRHRAFQLAQRFKRYNDQSIRDLARVYDEADEQTYLRHAKNWMAALEQTLSSDQSPIMREVDRGWEAPPPTL